MKIRFIIPFYLLFACIAGLPVTAYAVPQLTIGVAAEKMNNTARLNFGIADSSASYAGVNAKIQLPANVSVKSVSKGDLLSSSFFTSHYSPAANVITVMAYSGAAVFSGNGILFTLELDTASASDGTHSVVFGNSSNAFVNSRCALSDTSGNSVILTQKNGYLAVGQTDSDNDGLPDALEYAIVGNYTGLSPDDDFDKDGRSNLAEYLSMTDLNNPFSFAEIMKGDLNNDQEISLADTIIALQIVTGISVSNISSEAAIDGKKIGLADAVYSLQLVSDLRD